MMSENSPGFRVSVPLNIRCSRKCASPDSPACSSAAPTRYHTELCTIGARRFTTTTTCRPLSRVKLTGSKTLAWAGVRRAGVRRAKAAARRTASAPGREARNRAGRRETANSETPSGVARDALRSEEHTSELQSLMRISYDVFCLKKTKRRIKTKTELNTCRNTHSKQTKQRYKKIKHQNHK